MGKNLIYWNLDFSFFWIQNKVLKAFDETFRKNKASHRCDISQTLGLIRGLLRNLQLKCE